MKASCDGKSVAFHQHRARSLLKAAYAHEMPSKGELADYHAQKHCIGKQDVRKRLAALRDKLKRKLEQRQEAEAVSRLTPYPGPNGTHWAIPWSIVSCESGGSWTAANPSGAIGPYQLLGWGAPWPVTSEADKLAHHRIAAQVWAGGAGRSNWVC